MRITANIYDLDSDTLLLSLHRWDDFVIEGESVLSIKTSLPSGKYLISTDSRDAVLPDDVQLLGRGPIGANFVATSPYTLE